MTRACAILCTTIGVLACAAPASAQSGVAVWTDPADDAKLRRTDTGNNGPVLAGATLPDVVEVRLSAWANPYEGSPVPAGSAHLFRLDVVFNGLVNPPGTVGIGGQPFNPYAFGFRPVFGTLEIDVDNDVNTGGEFDPGARVRYLANVARFGRVPGGTLAPRAARSANDYNSNFSSEPQYERSGGDFVLMMCGCWAVTIVSEGGNANGIMDPGETWIVRGRFLQRVAGYACASSAFGGSGFGLYDPWVHLRFSHDISTNRTTLTHIGALNMIGAGALAGQPAQPVNLNAGDHTSILEGLQDIINNAPTLSGNCKTLAQGWQGRDPVGFLDPTRWNVRGIFGTSYSLPEDSLFAWTDTGFDEVAGDLDGDRTAGPSDRTLVQQTIGLLDGGPEDADGLVNGSVKIVNYGFNFHLMDVDGDGFINSWDVTFYCPADYNGDGVLNLADLNVFQTLFVLGDPRADFNHDGALNVADFGAFMSAYALGCP